LAHEIYSKLIIILQKLFNNTEVLKLQEKDILLT